MFGCRGCKAKDAEIERLIAAKDSEVEFLRTQVAQLEDRLMATCDKLSTYEPHRADRPTGPLEQPLQVDINSGKVYRWNDELAMYDEVKDEELVRKHLEHAKLSKGVQDIEKGDEDWHEKKDEFISEQERAWAGYVDQQAKRIKDIYTKGADGAVPEEKKEEQPASAEAGT